MPGKSYGRRSLEGCSPWSCTESDTTERLHFHFSLSCTGEGNGYPLQCSCLENPRDRGAWWAAVSGVVQSRTRLKRLSSSSSSSILFPVGFPSGPDGRESAYSAGDLGSVPGLGRVQGREGSRVRKDPGSGRSLREGSGHPHKYFCLEDSMAKKHSSWGCKELDMTDNTHTHSSP